MALFNKLKSKQTINKTFSYSKGNCNLSFTLNIENKGEMKDFIELLVEAQKEVSNEIK